MLKVKEQRQLREHRDIHDMLSGYAFVQQSDFWKDNGGRVRQDEAGSWFIDNIPFQQAIAQLNAFDQLSWWRKSGEDKQGFNEWRALLLAWHVGRSVLGGPYDVVEGWLHGIALGRVLTPVRNVGPKIVELCQRISGRAVVPLPLVGYTLLCYQEFVQELIQRGDKALVWWLPWRNVREAVDIAGNQLWGDTLAKVKTDVLGHSNQPLIMRLFVWLFNWVFGINAAKEKLLRYDAQARVQGWYKNDAAVAVPALTTAELTTLGEVPQAVQLTTALNQPLPIESVDEALHRQAKALISTARDTSLKDYESYGKRFAKLRHDLQALQPSALLAPYLAAVDTLEKRLQLVDERLSTAIRNHDAACAREIEALYQAIKNKTALPTTEGRDSACSQVKEAFAQKDAGVHISHIEKSLRQRIDKQCYRSQLTFLHQRNELLRLQTRLEEFRTEADALLSKRTMDTGHSWLLGETSWAEIVARDNTKLEALASEYIEVPADTASKQVDVLTMPVKATHNPLGINLVREVVGSYLERGWSDDVASVLARLEHEWEHAYQQEAANLKVVLSGGSLTFKQCEDNDKLIRGTYPPILENNEYVARLEKEYAVPCLHTEGQRIRNERNQVLVGFLGRKAKSDYHVHRLHVECILYRNFFDLRERAAIEQAQRVEARLLGLQHRQAHDDHIPAEDKPFYSAEITKAISAIKGCAPEKQRWLDEQRAQRQYTIEHDNETRNVNTDNLRSLADEEFNERIEDVLHAIRWFKQRIEGVMWQLKRDLVYELPQHQHENTRMWKNNLIRAEEGRIDAAVKQVNKWYRSIMAIAAIDKWQLATGEWIDPRITIEQQKRFITYQQELSVVMAFPKELVIDDYESDTVRNGEAHVERLLDQWIADYGKGLDLYELKHIQACEVSSIEINLGIHEVEKDIIELLKIRAKTKEIRREREKETALRIAAEQRVEEERAKCDEIAQQIISERQKAETERKKREQEAALRIAAEQRAEQDRNRREKETALRIAAEEKVKQAREDLKAAQALVLQRQAALAHSPGVSPSIPTAAASPIVAVGIWSSGSKAGSPSGSPDKNDPALIINLAKGDNTKGSDSDSASSGSESKPLIAQSAAVRVVAAMANS